MKKIIYIASCIFILSCQAPDIQKDLDQLYIAQGLWDFGDDNSHSFGNANTAAMDAIAMIEKDEEKEGSQAGDTAIETRVVEDTDFEPRVAAGSGINYPKYTAISTQAYIKRKNDTYNFTHTLSYNMSDTKITIRNEQFDAKQYNVNKALKSKENTATIYDRTTQQEYIDANAQDNNIKDLKKIFIFASKGTTEKGNFTFEMPIPVIPALLNKNGLAKYLGKSYTLNVPVKGTMSINMKTKVSIQSTSSDLVSIVIENDIGKQGIDECRSLENFIQAKKTTFVINTTNETITSTNIENCSAVLPGVGTYIVSI